MRVEKPRMDTNEHEFTNSNDNSAVCAAVTNDGREFRHKGIAIVWFHWCLFVFTGGLTESLRLSSLSLPLSLPHPL
jgi:hypothetical protein